MVPADVSLTEQVVDYYRRNRQFLQKFEPIRGEEFSLWSIFHRIEANVMPKNKAPWRLGRPYPHGQDKLLYALTIAFWL